MRMRLHRERTPLRSLELHCHRVARAVYLHLGSRNPRTLPPAASTRYVTDLQLGEVGNCAAESRSGHGGPRRGSTLFCRWENFATCQRLVDRRHNVDTSGSVADRCSISVSTVATNSNASYERFFAGHVAPHRRLGITTHEYVPRREGCADKRIDLQREGVN